MSEVLSLGEPADEAQWRALVEQGLKGAPWARLIAKTADEIAIQPLYREADMATASDVSGFPGAAPFVRGDRAGAWMIRQTYEHPDPAQTNAEILADLAGGVDGVELVIDPAGQHGLAVRSADDLDIALSGVILEAAPVSLDAGAHANALAHLLGDKLKGASGRGVAFNLDPLGVLMRTGEFKQDALAETARQAAFLYETAPEAGALRVDARPVCEAGGTQTQEIAAALACGIEYLRSLDLAVDESASLIRFAVSVGPDVLIEAAKLRALRLCWARVLEASGASPQARAGHIHAFTQRRMMTRYDAWTNILRVTTATFAAAIGGADAITTYPFTDAQGLPTPFARRLARNTQNVLMEECRLGHVADPTGGAWFVERMTRDLAASAWEVMQLIEARGGIVSALQTGLLQDLVGGARTARQQAIATRAETITGVTDFPLLDAKPPEVAATRLAARRLGGVGLPLGAIRWAAPFESLRERAEAHEPRPAVFFANMASLAEFGPRAQFASNLFAAGGVSSIGPEQAHANMETLIDAFRETGARVAVITGADASYRENAENAAQRLKAGGAHWVVIADKPGANEVKLRAAGVDQFVFAGQDALAALTELHHALGIGA